MGKKLPPLAERKIDPNDIYPYKTNIVGVDVQKDYIIIDDKKDDAPVYIKMEEQQQAEMIERIKKRNERKILEGCVSSPAPEKKPYPLTKKIGLAVLVVTESMVLALFGWAVYAEKMQESFDAAGYQMIIFASFWGVKAVADNIKAVRGK